MIQRLLSNKVFNFFVSIFTGVLILFSVRVFATTLPVPTMPTKAWKDYVVAHNYEVIPQYFGFKLNLDAAGNPKTRPLLTNTIPVVIKCLRTEGCSDYGIAITTSSVEVDYLRGRWNGDPTALILKARRYSSDSKPFAVESVYIPKDRAGHNANTYNLTAQTDPNAIIKWGGPLPPWSAYPALKTNYNDIMAVVYLRQDSLKNDANLYLTAEYIFNLDGRNSAGTMVLRNDRGEILHPLTGYAYNQSGVFWNLIDSTNLGPGASWNKTEKVMTGTTETTNTSVAITLGFELGGGDWSPVQFNTQFESQWDSNFSIEKSNEVETIARCENPSDSGRNTVCGFYQAYGATQIIAPGMATDSFNIFAQVNQNPTFASQVYFGIGDMGTIVVDDTQKFVGTIYPLAGTALPATLLDTGVAQIQKP